MRVYVYGARAPTTELNRVTRAMSDGHRYYNQLVEIERQRRDQISLLERARIPDEVVEVERLVAALGAARAKVAEAKRRERSAEVSEDLAQEIRTILAQLKIARQALGDARRRLKNDREYQAEVAAVHAMIKDRVKTARATNGLSNGGPWGTYVKIEQAIEEAKKAQQVRFKRSHRGRLSVQLQGGLSVEDALTCEDTRIRIRVTEGAERWPTVRLRVGSDGRLPIWCDVPVLMHRPLPPGGRIKWVHLTRDLVADQERWSVSFEVDAVPSRPSLAAEGSRCGVDVGWRLMPDGGLRAAVAVGDDGRVSELRYPVRLLQRERKVHDLQAIRDKRYDAIRAIVIAVRDSAPEWYREATSVAHAWRSPARLVLLLRRWMIERWDGDAEAHAAVVEWHVKDRHLWRWQEHQRRRVLGWRRDLQRVWAAALVRRYHTVVLEDLDLRELAQRPEIEEGTVSNQREDYHLRGFAAVGELRTWLRHVAGAVVEVDAAYTTRTCHACGSVEDWDQARHLRHTCAACGAEWDQDENAARNLLASGKAAPCAPAALETGKPGERKEMSARQTRFRSKRTS